MDVNGGFTIKIQQAPFDCLMSKWGLVKKCAPTSEIWTQWPPVWDRGKIPDGGWNFAFSTPNTPKALALSMTYASSPTPMVFLLNSDRLGPVKCIRFH